MYRNVLWRSKESPFFLARHECFYHLLFRPPSSSTGLAGRRVSGSNGLVWLISPARHLIESIWTSHESRLFSLFSILFSWFLVLVLVSCSCLLVSGSTNKKRRILNPAFLYNYIRNCLLKQPAIDIISISKKHQGD
jgi:hypothetical protein